MRLPPGLLGARHPRAAVVNCRQGRRADKIAEHYGQLPALGGGGSHSCFSYRADLVLCSAAIASSNLRRWLPSTTPRSLTSSAVSFGSASQSMRAGSRRVEQRLT